MINNVASWRTQTDKWKSDTLKGERQSKANTEKSSARLDDFQMSLNS